MFQHSDTCYLLARIMTHPPDTPRSKNQPVNLARCKREKCQKSFPAFIQKRTLRNLMFLIQMVCKEGPLKRKIWEH